ncbi:MAG: SRPBCC domain-containing protein [Bacteroidota bacterium]
MNNRTLTIKRTLKAPVQLVWEAWSEPGHIVKWWGPQGMETKVNKHDFRVGGEWNYSMEMPDGNQFVAEGVYKEIEHLRKIISSADFKPMTEGVEIQAIFEEAGDETVFTFNVVHPTVEYCQQQEQMGFMNGWGSVFDRLEEMLATQ